MFQLKHSDQIKAVKDLLAMGDFNKQLKIIQLMLEKMVQVMVPAKVTLENNGYIPGGEFPIVDKAREALSLVVENTALFSEILLHLPDVVHNLLQKVSEKSIFNWSIFFTNQTNLVDQKTRKLLTLAAVELELVPKPDNYINPYKYKFISQKQDTVPPTPQPKKIKKKKPRGPQLSNIKHSEL